MKYCFFMLLALILISAKPTVAKDRDFLAIVKWTSVNESGALPEKEEVAIHFKSVEAFEAFVPDKTSFFGLNDITVTIVSVMGMRKVLIAATEKKATVKNAVSSINLLKQQLLIAY
jgi:hypothetical protein